MVTHSGRTKTELDALKWAALAERNGAGEILLTSFDRDGTRSGYDLPLLRAIGGAVKIPVIASGGAASPADLVAAAEAGASAVLAASIFHDAEYSVGDVKRVLLEAGYPVRP